MCITEQKKYVISSSIDIKVRKTLLKTYIRNVAPYGSETWTIDKTKEKNS